MLRQGISLNENGIRISEADAPALVELRYRRDAVTGDMSTPKPKVWPNVFSSPNEELQFLEAASLFLLS